MKKINLKGKLSLGKETVSKLNNGELNVIIGGRGPSAATVCNQCDTYIGSTCAKPTIAATCNTNATYCC